MNRKDFILTCISVFLAAILIVGCAHTNQIVSQAKGPIPADSARILLTREKISTGVGFVITDNGKNIGVIGPGGQLEWDRIAGPMKLTASIFDSLEGKSNPAYPPVSMLIGVGAGMSYHLVVHWSLNSSTPDLKLVSGTPVAYAQSNGTDMTSTTDTQRIAQNSASIASSGTGTQNATDTYTGTVTGGNFAKGVGFSNVNVKLEVTADNGDKAIFFVRSDSKVIDASGKQINYLEASRSKNKKVEIKYFTITDATGGDPSRSDFAYEIGQKGVLVLRFLN
ncbi:MAG: hypothetical protein ABSC11_01775 [Smithella sp.]|jgi:hypothetical protein